MKCQRWAKICGVLDADEAVEIAELGASALGLNLWPGSPRCISVERAHLISARLKTSAPEVERVGVTVNYSDTAEAYLSLARDAGLTCVQLHGEEPEELAQRILQGDVPVIRAFRLGSESSERRDAISRCIGRYQGMGCRVLLDARVPGTYGGTGKVIDAELLGWFLERHLLLVAGGLTPDNIGALASAAPWPSREDAGGGFGFQGVDVASGVENHKGRKDLNAVRRFIRGLRGV